MYDTMSRTYPGWALSEIRDLSIRERNNWLEIVRWRRR